MEQTGLDNERLQEKERFLDKFSDEFKENEDIPNDQYSAWFDQAAKFDLLNILVKIVELKGVDFCKTFSNTLYTAVQNNSQQCADFLIENQIGFDIHETYDDGRNLFLLAIQKCFPINFLQKLHKLGVDVHKKDNDGENAIFYCIDYHSRRNTDLLIEKIEFLRSLEIDLHCQNNWSEENILFTTARSAGVHSLNLRKYLISLGVNYQLLNFDSENILFVEILNFTETGHDQDDLIKEIIHYYISLGIDPHHENDRKENLILAAISIGLLSAVNFLISIGVQSKNLKKSALKCAIKSNDLQIVKFVLQNQLDSIYSYHWDPSFDLLLINDTNGFRDEKFNDNNKRIRDQGEEIIEIPFKKQKLDKFNNSNYFYTNTKNSNYKRLKFSKSILHHIVSNWQGEFESFKQIFSYFYYTYDEHINTIHPKSKKIPLHSLNPYFEPGEIFPVLKYLIDLGSDLLHVNQYDGSILHILLLKFDDEDKSVINEQFIDIGKYIIIRSFDINPMAIRDYSVEPFFPINSKEYKYFNPKFIDNFNNNDKLYYHDINNYSNIIDFDEKMNMMICDWKSDFLTLVIDKVPPILKLKDENDRYFDIFFSLPNPAGPFVITS